ncbi:MAG: ROK family transcriptional regulator [Bacteroidota bacterium]
MKRQTQSLSSTRLMRSANAVSVLRTLYNEGGCSRPRLTRLTRMSPATITRIIAELLDQGFIRESGVAESSGGRKAAILELNYDRIFILGIQALRDRVDLAVTDLRGRFVARRSFCPYSLEPDSMIEEMTKGIEALLDESAVAKERLIGVGVAISGIVDSVNGILQRSTNLGWREVAIAKALDEGLGIPVVVENDANAAALAELWFGLAKEASSFLYIKTDRGVGAGVIYERNLLVGARGMSGEIGHVPLMRPGRPCRCGQSGCLETYLYIPDVLRRYEKATGRRLAGGEEFFALAGEGDADAAAMVAEAAEALGVAASLAAGLLDLDMVVIGGIWGRLGHEFMRKIRRVYQAVLEGSGLSKDLAVIGSGLGEEADLLGAAGLVIARWLTPPIQASYAGRMFHVEKELV